MLIIQIKFILFNICPNRLLWYNAKDIEIYTKNRLIKLCVVLTKISS